MLLLCYTSDVTSWCWLLKTPLKSITNSVVCVVKRRTLDKFSYYSDSDSLFMSCVSAIIGCQHNSSMSGDAEALIARARAKASSVDVVAKALSQKVGKCTVQAYL